MKHSSSAGESGRQLLSQFAQELALTRFAHQCIQSWHHCRGFKPPAPQRFLQAEGPPMPVIRTNAMTFDASVPVLVVGAGGCGMTAALAAADGGAEVMVLE